LPRSWTASERGARHASPTLFSRKRTGTSACSKFSRWTTGGSLSIENPTGSASWSRVDVSTCRPYEVPLWSRTSARVEPESGNALL
jgi:hypothetical protein